MAKKKKAAKKRASKTKKAAPSRNPPTKKKPVKKKPVKKKPVKKKSQKTAKKLEGVSDVESPPVIYEPRQVESFDRVLDLGVSIEAIRKFTRLKDEWRDARSVDGEEFHPTAEDLKSHPKYPVVTRPKWLPVTWTGKYCPDSLEPIAILQWLDWELGGMQAAESVIVSNKGNRVDPDKATPYELLLQDAHFLVYELKKEGFDGLPEEPPEEIPLHVVTIELRKIRIAVAKLIPAEEVDVDPTLIDEDSPSAHHYRDKEQWCDSQYALVRFGISASQLSRARKTKGFKGVSVQWEMIKPSKRQKKYVHRRIDLEALCNAIEREKTGE